MLILIASYPKSGSTWMRRFLSSYTLGKKVGLDDLARVCPVIYHPGVLKENLGLDYLGEDPATLPFIRNRPEIYRRFAGLGDAKDRTFLKTHAANLSVDDVPQNPDEHVHKYVYIVRHPLDVIPSYASHLGLDAEETWNLMREDAFMTRKSGDENAHNWELVSSWERHTRSWLELHASSKMLVVRYEDMFLRPITTFGKVLRHLDLPHNETLFGKALCWSDFEIMRREEEEMDGGYRESTSNARFFRKGTIGDGAASVPERIQDEIRALFPDLLRALSYQ